MPNLNEKITVRKKKKTTKIIDTIERLEFLKPKCQLINFEAYRLIIA